MSAPQDTSFARLTSLAAHDLRTPLATVFGFARTIQRSAELEPPASRYVEMIVEASLQMTELLEKLALVARIEADRYEPLLAEVDTARARTCGGSGCRRRGNDGRDGSADDRACSCRACRVREEARGPFRPSRSGWTAPS
jgi:hypothetical protein